jgi:hypothetical protein
MKAMSCIEDALSWLKQRTEDRIVREVKNTDNV